jgi:two-component system alkaline phosphatase synthesis response regulator PhoP
LPEGGNAMPQKILVVDDEPNIVKLVESRLKASGYDVVTAKDGQDALAKAKQTKPDLILLDIMMPGMNGQETLKELKKDASVSSIPVIMLTAKQETDDIVKSIVNGGAVDYIVKPFIATDFLKKINTVLSPDKKVPENTCDQELLDTVEKKIKKALEGNK